MKQLGNLNIVYLMIYSLFIFKGVIMALFLCEKSPHFAQKHIEVIIDKILKCPRFALLKSRREREIGRGRDENSCSWVDDS